MARRAEQVRPAVGLARVDTRTKRLVARLQRGEIAVIHHEDLDRIAAEGLVEAGAGGVVNAARSISGRYPNMGPLLLAAAGIPLLDDAGDAVMQAVREGQLVRIEGEHLLVGGERVASGTRHSLQSLEHELQKAKDSLGMELARFAENTLEYMQAEQHLLTDSPPMPDLRASIKGRDVLVVVRGIDYKQDLAALGAYIRDTRPVLIGVDGGADALLDAGHKPDIVLGDFDSVSDSALRSGAQLLVHAYPDGRAPGAERLDRAGLGYDLVSLAGTSEDVALLLAYEKGAELIVAVGTHASLVEFLDKGRAGMASTFLVRLKVGPILVDAKGVNRLYQPRIRRRDMTFVVLAALLAMLVVMAVSPGYHVFWRSLWTSLTDAWYSLTR